MRSLGARDVARWFKVPLHLIEDDRYQVAIPKACLADERWRRAEVARVRQLAASRGYRGHLRFAWQGIYGPPGGRVLVVQVFPARPR